MTRIAAGTRLFAKGSQKRSRVCYPCAFKAEQLLLLVLTSFLIQEHQYAVFSSAAAAFCLLSRPQKTSKPKSQQWFKNKWKLLGLLMLLLEGCCHGTERWTDCHWSMCQCAGEFPGEAHQAWSWSQRHVPCDEGRAKLVFVALRPCMALAWSRNIMKYVIKMRIYIYI